LVLRRFWGIAGALLLAIGVAFPAAASPRFAYPWLDYSVLPIFFVPTDWSVNGDEVRGEAAALRTAVDEIRAFYGRENSDWTFTLDPLQVVQGEGPRTRYHIIWNGRNIYEDGVEFDGNMEHEVVSELHSRGYPTPVAQNESGYSVLIFVKGAGGWAGGREFPDADGGWAILGDWTIDSIEGQLHEGDYWWSGRRLQVGAAAHELGHTFDLPHPDVHGDSFDSSIMGSWWGYPMLGLSDWERDHIATVKAQFFQERLGLPTAWKAVHASDVTGVADGSTEARIRHGSAESLWADDGDRLLVGPVPSDDGYSATIYVRFAGVPNGLTSLRITGRDRTSVGVDRSVEVLDARYGWVALASGAASRAELPFNAASLTGPATTLVSGISGPGEVLIRVRYTSLRRFTASVDELGLQVEEVATHR
jgi:hypothetical protein